MTPEILYAEPRYQLAVDVCSVCHDEFLARLAELTRRHHPEFLKPGGDARRFAVMDVDAKYQEAFSLHRERCAKLERSLCDLDDAKPVLRFADPNSLFVVSICQRCLLRAMLGLWQITALPKEPAP